MRVRTRLAAAGLAGVLAGAGGPLAGPALAAGHPGGGRLVRPAAGHHRAAGRLVRPAAAPAAGMTTAIAGGPGRGPAWTVAQQPKSLATGPDGSVYVGDGFGVVRRFGPSATWESVAAGLGQASFSGHAPHLGDSRLAARADLSFVDGLALDAAGNLVAADTGDNRVRVVASSSGTFYGRPMTAGHIYTIAGNGGSGFTGDGGRATAARLTLPEGLAVDAAGNVVIADTGNYRIRVVAASTGTFYGHAMTAGHIYTIAGNGGSGFTGDGGRATAARLTLPEGLAVDAAGSVVIADTGSHRIRVVAAAAGTFYGRAMTAGDIYTVAGNGTGGFGGDGGPATSADLRLPSGVVLDGSGNLVIADTGNHRVRVAATATGTFYGQAMTAGDIYTVAGNGSSAFGGNGGPATAAGIGNPLAVAFDSSGNLVIANGLGRVWVAAAATGSLYGRAMTAGHIYAVAGHGPPSSGNGRLARNAVVFAPSGITVQPGSTPNVVVYDQNQVRLVAAATGTFFGQAMTAGHIYALAGNGSYGFGGDGGPATSARIGITGGVAMDTAGNLVIADQGSNRVRMVAAATGTFYGVPMTAGDIYTVAGSSAVGFGGDGGPATSAQLSSPSGVTVDGPGNLVIADQGSNRIRVVAASSGTFYGQAMTAGDIYTVAGSGGPPDFAGDGGPATSARLSLPSGVAVDTAGNLVIADEFSNRIRVVAAATGTFYGQAMTARDVYTVAGDGSSTVAGDGGPALSAGVLLPRAVTIGASGSLVLTSGNRVRVVAGATGTFYGQAMTAGDIYNLAGSLLNPWPGIPRALAALLTARGVAAGSSGDIFITDSTTRRVFEIGR